MIRRRLVGLAASLAIVAILAGLPIVLVAVGGNPIPTELPTPADFLDWFTTPDDGTLALNAIILGGWLVWAFLAFSIIAELIAAVRGVRAPALPGLRMPQDTARRLVATAALLFVTTPGATLATPALASGNTTPPPVTAQVLAPANGINQHVPARAGTQATGGQPRPDSTAVLEHVVEPGDTLTGVAETYLGDGDRWPEIYEATQHLTQPADQQLTDPDIIDIGWTLNIPTSSHQPAAGDGTTLLEHIAKPGDTLSSVAEAYLGDADRWPEIYAATQSVIQPDGLQLTDPDVIDAGWTLKIPVPAANPATQTVQEQVPAGRPVPAPSPTIDPCEPEPANAPPGDGTAGNPSRGGLAPGGDHDTRTVEPAPAAPTRDDQDDEALSAPWLLSGVAGSIVLSASALLVLRSRRRQQQRERRPGRAIATPPPVIAPVEKTITAVGTRGLPSVERMDEALCRLAEAQTSAGRPMPKLVAIELGRDGLTLHMAEPVTDLTGPWQQLDANAQVWRLPANTDLAAVGYLPEYQPAPYPLLVSCGTADDGHTWLLNLEQLATIHVTGDPVYTEDFLRYLVTELAVNPWSRAAKVTTYGLEDDLSAIDVDRLTTATTIQDAARAARANAEFAARLAELVEADTATARAGGLGDEAWGAHALIVHSEHPDPDLDQLVDWTAQHPGQTGAAIVISGPAETQATQIHLTPQGRTIVESLGLNLVAVGLTSDEARGCATLLATSDDTQDVPMPVDTTAREGWQALADRAGALRPELTVSRAVPDTDLLEEAVSLIPDDLPLPDSVLEEDLELLAPKVPISVRTAAELADPTLDDDVADWWSDNCVRPRLALLGPVAVKAHGKPIAKRKPYYIEVLSFIALRQHGATTDDVVTAFGFGSTSTARSAVNIVRGWLGTNPATGQPHLPSAPESSAGQVRGVGVYQVEDLLIDIDLFKRLRLRGQTRGVDGIEDLITALRLVRGRPFDQLRPNGWAWLVDTGEQHHMAAAIADVAHAVATHHLQTHQLRKARQVTGAALLAVPDDYNLQADLLVITMAEGHPEIALRMYQKMCNQPDEDGIPAEVGARIEQVLAKLDWKRAARAS